MTEEAAPAVPQNSPQFKLELPRVVHLYLNGSQVAHEFTIARTKGTGKKPKSHKYNNRDGKGRDLYLPIIPGRFCLYLAYIYHNYNK